MARQSFLSGVHALRVIVALLVHPIILIILGSLSGAIFTYALDLRVSKPLYVSEALVRLDPIAAETLRIQNTNPRLADAFLRAYPLAGKDTDARVRFLMSSMRLIEIEKGKRATTDNLYRLEVVTHEPKVSQRTATEILDEWLRFSGQPPSVVVSRPNLPTATGAGRLERSVLGGLVCVPTFFAVGLSFSHLMRKRH